MCLESMKSLCKVNDMSILSATLSKICLESFSIIQVCAFRDSSILRLYVIINKRALNMYLRNRRIKCKNHGNT